MKHQENVVWLPVAQVHPDYTGMSHAELGARLCLDLWEMDTRQLAALSWAIAGIKRGEARCAARDGPDSSERPPSRR